ncbi:hypothetical protein MKEN_00354700 [Mycena kentingensis (nom. inval.)]|nr:hypothetical protein MKEN_00354700 [Mycena kentingensis (nom. inval.)]
MSVAFLKVGVEFYNAYSPNKCGNHPLQRSEKRSAAFVSLDNVQRIKVLERVEYRRILNIIWDEIDKREKGEEPNMGSLVVWGQSGIGKSMFLDYALAMAIHRRIFVLYSNNKHRVAVFDPSKEPYALNPDDLWDLDLPDIYLVLSDSTYSLQTPLDFFVDTTCGAFLVHATSPMEPRHRSWMKDKDALLYPMEPLPKTDCDQTSGSQVEGSNFFTPEELYDLLGPMPQPALEKYVRVENPTPTDLGLTEPSNLFSDPKLLARALISGSVMPTSQISGFDDYFVIIPDPMLPKPTGTKNPGHSYLIGTPFLRKLLVDYLRKQSLEKRMKLAASLSSVYSLAGALFEANMPIYLSLAPHPLELHFHSPQTNYALPSQLVLSPTAFDISLPSRPALNTLFTPGQRQSAFDAFCITRGALDAVRVNILQAAVARSREIGQDGIRELIDALDLPGTIDWRVVFVAPSAEIGVAVSKQFWCDGFRISSKNVTIPVGWAVLPFADGLSEFESCLTASELLSGESNTGNRMGKA